MNNLPDVTRKHWFALALSSGVRQELQRRLFFGIPVALGRDRSGRAFALEDRCPHRGVPLSKGTIEAEGIVCPYHGWTYSAEGRCVRMPGAPDDRPLTEVRAPALNVTERDGVLWVCQSTDPSLPERVIAMDPGHRRFLWHSVWRAPVVDVLENFLDPLHTHNIHPGLVRRAQARVPVTAALRMAGDGFHVDYTGTEVQSGWLFKMFESRRTLERAHLSGPGVAQLEYQYAGGWSACISIHCAPETATTTHVVATLHVQGRFAPAWLVRALVWPFLRRVANQDKAILELQQNARSWFPNRRDIVSPLDITRPYIEAAWSADAHALPTERLVTMRL